MNRGRPLNPYWHKLPKDDQESVFEYSKFTVKSFMEKFRQPKWCGYEGALHFGPLNFGCWSLAVPGRITDQNGPCETCELNTHPT